MSQLQINSLPITDGFLSLDALADLDALSSGREIEPDMPTDGFLTDLGIQPDTATETPEPSSDRPIALDEVEELILGFLESKPDQNFKASEIRSNVRRLKDSVPLPTIEKICEGLAKVERIIPIVDSGSKPRYMAR
jgi:hypothetical protein